jgi:hypothetical protein
MEPNKLEKQIREKLLGREIQPSANSWDRLDAMLSVQEEKKSRKMFPWLSIAAGFFVLAGLGYFILDQSQKNEIDLKNRPSVVETYYNTSDTETEIEDVQFKSSLTDKTEESYVEVNHKVKSISKKSNKVSHDKESTIEKKERSIAFTEAAPKDIKKIVQEEKLPVSQKQEMNPESLLAQVEKPKIETKSKVKVSARSLLSQVDGEIELTFRQKVFRSIKKNYEETKVAIANRNLEESSNH